jgi:hypothetical protein
LVEKFSKLDEITRHFFPGKIIPQMSGHRIRVLSETVSCLFGIDIDVPLNMIHVYDPAYFETAKKIAGAYESQTQPSAGELIIETNYRFYNNLFPSRA